MAGPLVGLRVVEIGDRGEVAGKLLADAGAELIRVEPPSGARSRGTGPFVGDRRDINASLHYAYLNTNKRGVTLDVAQSEVPTSGEGSSPVPTSCSTARGRACLMRWAPAMTRSTTTR